ncbi:hypothetical protein M513_01804, partial [Trichuris suis]
MSGETKSDKQSFVGKKKRKLHTYEKARLAYERIQEEKRQKKLIVMRRGIYCWDRNDLRRPFTPTFPSTSRSYVTPKRRYVWRIQVPSSRLPNSSVSSALKIVSKYRLRRKLPCNRVTKLHSAHVPSTHFGRFERNSLKSANTRSRYVLRRNSLCSRYKFRRHRSHSGLPRSPAAIRLSRQRHHVEANASLLAASKLLKNTKANIWRQKNRHTLERRKECLFFNKYGRCFRGERCSFQHDPEKVRVCTKFSLGKCQDNDCRYRHVYSRDQMPVCHFFRKGLCKSFLCPYLHTENADAAKHGESSDCQADSSSKNVETTPTFAVTNRRTINGRLTGRSASRISLTRGSKKWTPRSLKHSSSRLRRMHAAKHQKMRMKKNCAPTTYDSVGVLGYIPIPSVNESDVQAETDDEISLSNRPILISDLIPPMIELPDDIRILFQQDEKEEREKKRNEALKRSRQDRMRKDKLLRKRTRKGQPALGLQIQYLLSKIEKQILCDAHPSSSRSDLKCMRSLVNYFRLLLRSGRRILFKMGENVTEHNNVFDELPLKRVRQESDTEKTEAGEEKGTEFVRKKKLKYALLLSYRGKAYHGMQINQETPTIEYFLFDALKKLNYISEEQARKPSCFKFQRAARTDKGVSAARQVCSVQLPLKEDSTDEAVASLNHLLPEDIRVMAIQRTTRGFDSKKWCDSRLYSYVLPAFCFAPLQENYDPDSYHLPDEILNEVNHILQYYVGTHNFFNFTSGKTYTEESSKRYIMECKCSRLAAVDAPEYLIVSFKGQSFLIHQIRKMIGLCISIVRGHCTEDYMKSVWLPERVRIPMAPALGLLLEEPYFTYYNQRFGTTHKPISWESVTEKCDQFREQYIIADMIETDKKEKLFDDWLRYLGDTFWKKDDNEDKDDDPLEADVTAKASHDLKCPVSLHGIIDSLSQGKSCWLTELLTLKNTKSKATAAIKFIP